MADVQISDLWKFYDGIEVVRGVDIDIADGEFVVLVGPSGCGKSTLLRMISGLEVISEGEIRIDGERVNEISPKNRDIAMVFQNYALYPHMNVADNMSFSLRLKRVGKEQIASGIRRVAGILGLETLLDRLPRQLSGGQRQRVAMGRAIVRNPKVFLFDEPLSNLDAKLRIQMRAEIKELHYRLSTTTVYVTHDQIEAMTLADKIVVMQDGRVEQIGTPLEVYDRPATAFVAQFIGAPAMNMIPGRVVLENGHPVLATEEGIRLPLPAAATCYEGRSVTYGIRPENVSIDATGTAGIPAVVTVVEPTGAETVVLTRVAGAPMTLIEKARVILKHGDEIRVAPDVERVHLFDAETGNRMGEEHMRATIGPESSVP